MTEWGGIMGCAGWEYEDVYGDVWNGGMGMGYKDVWGR